MEWIWGKKSRNIESNSDVIRKNVQISKMPVIVKQHNCEKKMYEYQEI